LVSHIDNVGRNTFLYGCIIMTEESVKNHVKTLRFD
jgi:hypothetical protein